ncbi:CoA transferase [Halalkalicoccus salilacus]|uniref:CoA transferase n=1 Tax=Halalkalicoccus sp. GCM10025704 TaxID=3252662 RepID=UPI003609C5E6
MGRVRRRDRPRGDPRVPHQRRPPGERGAGRRRDPGGAEKRPTDHWLEALTEAGFPNGPINDVRDIADHEQSRARNLVVDHEDPDWGSCLLPGHPIRFPEYDATVRSPAPRLGEHTEEVFAEVADDQTTLDEWTEGGAFGD